MRQRTSGHRGRAVIRRSASLPAFACAAVAACAGGVLAASPDPSRVFDLPRGRPTSIVVTRSAEPPGEVGESSEMIQTLSGVIGTMPAREWTRLRSMVRGGIEPASLEGASMVGVVHLGTATVTKRVEVLQLPDGSMVASEIDPLDEGGVAAAAVLPPEFARVVAGWARYRGGFEDGAADGTPAARSVDMAHPYVPGWITFDTETLEDRFLNGGDTQIRAAARDLEAETLWVRLPRGYDPRQPAGMLVWIDPTDSGQPPEFMHDAADELNFIIVGASLAGNNRYISDRHQLQFDAMATAMTRYHVDPTRIYAAGVSGGGRVACMYWACFPDVFSGAVAIVGTSCYQTVPMGNGAQIPRGFTLADGVRGDLRRHRLAAMTGPRDFNAFEIKQTIGIFDDDGFDARLFEYADMAHEYPTPARFREALEWVDEPWQNVRTEAVGRAESLLEGYRRRTEGAPTTPAERESLVRITEVAPWSAPAWEAALLLGFESGADGEAEDGEAQDVP